jgi:hypothetical protein
MLWTETNSYHPCCDPAQQWKFLQQPCEQGRRHLFGCIEDALKEMLVHKDLRTLCEVRRAARGSAERCVNHLGPHGLHAAFPPKYLLSRRRLESRVRFSSPAPVPEHQGIIHSSSLAVASVVTKSHNCSKEIHSRLPIDLTVARWYCEVLPYEPSGPQRSDTADASCSRKATDPT